MPCDTAELKQIEQLLLERRQHFITLNETTAEHNDDLCFMANEKLLSHYDQLIEIVRQAILIGEHLSPETRKQLVLADLARYSPEK